MAGAAQQKRCNMRAENAVDGEGNPLTGLGSVGTAELSDYAEMTLGAQVIFYF